MKKISIVSSCFNEEDNIPVLYRGINEVIEKYIERYDLSSYLSIMTRLIFLRMSLEN